MGERIRFLDRPMHLLFLLMVSSLRELFLKLRLLRLELRQLFIELTMETDSLLPVILHLLLLEGLDLVVLALLFPKESFSLQLHLDLCMSLRESIRSFEFLLSFQQFLLLDLLLLLRHFLRQLLLEYFSRLFSLSFGVKVDRFSKRNVR